ncbi:MAG: hypothetical protein E6J75_06590 [Deltaproteobacteria bacterium]|nr:MAG: hypothetical protein E6J75_06590 [Deltaproteobacteria bacterium]
MRPCDRRRARPLAQELAADALLELRHGGRLVHRRARCRAVVLGVDGRDGQPIARDLDALERQARNLAHDHLRRRRPQARREGDDEPEECGPARGRRQGRTRDAVRYHAVGAPTLEARHVLLDQQRQQGCIRIPAPAELHERGEAAGEAAPAVDPVRQVGSRGPATARVAHHDERRADRHARHRRERAGEDGRRSAEGEKHEDGLDRAGCRRPCHRRASGR